MPTWHGDTLENHRVYRNTDRVEVQQNGEWLKAMVFGFGEQDGVWKYYVQRSGKFPACDVKDPTCWFGNDDIRAT